MTWFTGPDEALLDLWPGAADLEESTLGIYLAAARDQCLTYLGARADGIEDNAIPPAWRVAQALQARGIARSGIASAGDEMGGYGETVTVFPMDWTVKNLLRPQGPVGVA